VNHVDGTSTASCPANHRHRLGAHAVGHLHKNYQQDQALMNVLDLFSGIGGFSLGLERAGMRPRNHESAYAFFCLTM
jgi:hypothetical protein